MARLGSGEMFRTVRLPKIGREGLLKTLLHLTKVKSVEELFSGTEGREEASFVDEIIRELDLSFQYFEEELKRIPTSGPVVLICNHPLAGIDALLLIKLVASIRPDLRIVGSDLWQRLKPIAHYWDLDESGVSSGASLSESLQEGKALAIFPAGTVSTNYRISKRQLEDGEWDVNMIREIADAQVPVTPVFFKANQTFLYHLLQRLGPIFQDLKVPSELRSYRSRPVTIRIGRTIYPKELALYPREHQLSALLRQRVYLLSNALHPEFKLFSPKRPAEPKSIADPVDTDLLLKEYEFLLEREALIEEKRSYQVFLCKAAQVPNMIREIGRLREITFRAIGEGSNLALDLDTFDYHYHHLILWDKEEMRIVGAYRLAIGSEVYPKYGFNGFYLSTLFKFKKRIQPMLERSLEMGRAFIIPAHQQKPLPLFVMWNGIREVMRRHEELEFIVGCASISNSFSIFSRNLMVAFLLKNFGDASLAQEIRPRKPFKLKLKSEARDLVMNSSPEDLVQFDRRIDEIEPGDLRIPPLIKKYLQQNALIVCFNVDPLFNNSLDGFMYIHRQNLEL